MHQNSTDWQEAMAAYQSEQYTRALDLLLPFARLGDAEAQCMIGSLYHFGFGVEVSGPEAAKWYDQAARQGYALAYNNLACLYRVGVPKFAVDMAKAREYYRKAAELGFEMIQRDWYE